MELTLYIVKLLIMLPLMAGLIYASLWMYRKMQPGMARADHARHIKITESLPLGNAGKLAMVEFCDQKILISISRGRIEALAQTDASAGPVPSDPTPIKAHEPSRFSLKKNRFVKNPFDKNPLKGDA